jgi:SAM-dependent methyltransferase
MKEINFKRFRWQYKHLYDKVYSENIRNILDLGCGDGKVVINFARMFPIADVAGVDKYDEYKDSPARRATAMKLIAEDGISQRCRILEVDAFKLPFSNGDFDIIHARNFLHHIFNSHDQDSARQIVSYFEKIRALIRKGGFFAISEVGPVNYLSYAKYVMPRWLFFINQAHNMDYKSKFSHKTWTDCLKEAGFDIVFLDHYVPYRLRHLKKVLANEFACRFFHSSYTILAQSQ